MSLADVMSAAIAASSRSRNHEQRVSRHFAWLDDRQSMGDRAAQMLSRHFDLLRDGEIVVSLEMAMFREACNFTIAGHAFAIRHTSIWKDKFQLLIGDKSVCEVTCGFWSRRFEMAAIEQSWILQRPSLFSREYQLLSGESEVGDHSAGRLVYPPPSRQFCR